MQINTLRFGTVEIDKIEIITVPEGIIGFPDIKRYVILDIGKDTPLLKDTLNNNYTNAIFGTIGLIDTNIDKVVGIGGEVGGIENRIEGMKGLLEPTKEDVTKQKSNLEDADMAKAASDLALLQTAYQATLQSTAKIIQPSLLDFIR